MPYDLSEDPYIDPKTKILKNKLGAKTQSELNRAESEITYIAILTLTRGSKPDSFVFDAALLSDIHKEIFRDIYTWAGLFRTHDISKEWSYFAHAAYIGQSLTNLLGGVEDDKLLCSEDTVVVITRITYYYSELNAIHPFREGNGRTARTFLRLLALKHGYDIEWARMDPEENINASIESLRTGNDAMLKMMSELVIKIDSV